jgi:16S rRNA processing protein RimM
LQATPVAGERVCLGVVVGAHGVRGQVKLRSFTEDPAAIAAYGPLGDEAGQRTFTAKVHGAPKEGVVVCSLSGVVDRDSAEALKGTRLYVLRSALPKLATEQYYHADLVGLVVETVTGERFGTVKAVVDYGAGDLLEIAPPTGETVLAPFTKAAVPVVDVPGGRLVIDPAVALPPAGGQKGATGPEDDTA